MKKKTQRLRNTEMNRLKTETNFSTLDSSLGLHGCQMVCIKTLYTQVPLEIICKANCDYIHCFREIVPISTGLTSISFYRWCSWDQGKNFILNSADGIIGRDRPNLAILFYFLMHPLPPLLSKVCDSPGQLASFFSSFLNIFGCTGSSFLCRLSLVAAGRDHSSLWCAGFSLQSTGSWRAGFSSCSTQDQWLQLSGARALRLSSCGALA